jgi:hypothetical protein
MGRPHISAGRVVVRRAVEGKNLDEYITSEMVVPAKGSLSIVSGDPQIACYKLDS